MQYSHLLSAGMAVLLCCLIILPAATAGDIVVFARTVEPAVYYSFSEGSGTRIVDLSGNGNSGLLYGNVSRIDNGDCGKAIQFDGRGSYIAVPSSSRNHPTREVTAGLRFLLNELSEAPLITTLNDGGYRLGFGDGNDLWWTVTIEGVGDVSVPLHHEEISLNEWHSAAGTYNGHVMKLFLDGKMYASKEITGSIHYTYENDLILGAEAGAGNSPPDTTPWFRGALDEVRLYTVAITNGEVIDDMVTCTPEKGPVALNIPAVSGAGYGIPAGSLSLSPGENRSALLRFGSGSIVAPWHVTVPEGSLLAVSIADLPATYPNSWKIEITDGSSVLGQTIWIQGQENNPAEAVITHGTADVTIAYQGGEGRFPAHTSVVFESHEAPMVAPAPIPSGPRINTGVVIYSLAGIAIIALLVVIGWFHIKKKEK